MSKTKKKGFWGMQAIDCPSCRPCHTCQGDGKIMKSVWIEQEEISYEVSRTLREFKAMQENYSEYGASDTEPDERWHRILQDFLEGKKPEIGNTVDWWGLFSSKPYSEEVAKFLCNKARCILRRLSKMSFEEVQKLNHNRG